MNKLIKITTGDDAKLYVTCNLNGLSTTAIDSGATITASITDNDKATLISSVSVPESNSGSDWSNRLVAVYFTSAQTSITTYGEAILEIQIDDGGKLTWHIPIIIEQGTI